MKLNFNKKFKSPLAILVPTVLVLVAIQSFSAQQTAFTYQGRLADNGSLPNTNYDMRFTLYDGPAGSFVAGPITKSGASTIPVKGGLFTTTLDFGPGIFTGLERWLKIEISPPGANNYTQLSALQQLTPAPYAIDAGTLGGQLPSGFAPASGSSAYVAKTGDTMTGWLGIGTAPATLFHLYNAGLATKMDGNSLSFTRTNGPAYILTENPGGRIDFVTGGRTPMDGNANLLLNTDMSSTFNGAVGIGTTPTADALTVAPLYDGGGISINGTTLLAPRIGLFGPSSGAAGFGLATRVNDFMEGPAVNDAVLFSSSGKLWLGTGPATAQPAMVVSGSHVGVGTASPDTALHVINPWSVLAGNYLAAIHIDQQQSGQYGQLRLSVRSNPYWAMATGDGASAPLFFFHSDVGTADGVHAMEIAPNGTVSVNVLTINGADVAEPFELSTTDIPKGSVVVIDEENAGRVKLSERAYDKRVAGILSGANGVTSGICLKQHGFNDGGENVALSGRVYALADACYGSIKPGDLLTTSDTPGHCMKAADHNRTQGAILGKAMSSLKEGKGMVLVLVSLQ